MQRHPISDVCLFISCELSILYAAFLSTRFDTIAVNYYSARYLCLLVYCIVCNKYTIFCGARLPTMRAYGLLLYGWEQHLYVIRRIELLGFESVPRLPMGLFPRPSPWNTFAQRHSHLCNKHHTDCPCNLQQYTAVCACKVTPWTHVGSGNRSMSWQLSPPGDSQTFLSTPHRQFKCSTRKKRARRHMRPYTSFGMLK